MPHINASKIQNICNERDISTLIHFTHIKNLPSILQKGLLSRYLCDQLPIAQQLVFNDSKRLDMCRQAICLSISFPNYGMFYKYQCSKPTDWVILTLKSSILWELDAAFCYENAASTRISTLPIEIRKQAHSLSQMFSDYEEIQRYNLQIPNNYPTNPQSEVLVLEPIPSHYISKIHFYNKSVAAKWLPLNGGVIDQVNSPFFDYSQKYFNPRQDWEIWKKRKT